MNNEEKILALLEQMNSRQNKTEAILEQIQKEQASFRAEANARFDEVEEKLENLESSINYAAKDAKSYIQRHEKEFHNVG